MRTATYNAINGFFCFIYAFVEKLLSRPAIAEIAPNVIVDDTAAPIVGDWYITKIDFDIRCYDGVYIVEKVVGNTATIRYHSLFCEYVSSLSHKIQFDFLEGFYVPVTIEDVFRDSEREQSEEI